MKIINLRPVDGAGSAVARFDIQITEEVKLLHWILRRREDGKLRAYPPSVRHSIGDGSAAALSLELFNAIQSEAAGLYNSSGRALAHDSRNAA